LTALHDLHGLGAATQVVRDIVNKVARQRDDDVGDPIAQDECIDASLKNRPPTEGEKLLRPVAAKAHASASGSNDGADVHGSAILPETADKTGADTSTATSGPGCSAVLQA
jgi:hypothetical protein